MCHKPEMHVCRHASPGDKHVHVKLVSKTTRLYGINYELCVVFSPIGYEPAGLTVHPPPRMIEGGFIFFVWVSSVTKIFS